MKNVEISAALALEVARPAVILGFNHEPPRPTIRGDVFCVRV